jgi:hypothetical protein
MEYFMITIRKISLLISFAVMLTGCVCGYGQVAVVDDFERGSADGWSGTYNSSISYASAPYSVTDTTTLYNFLQALADSDNMNILPLPVTLKKSDGSAPIGVAWDYVKVGDEIIVCCVNIGWTTLDLQWDTSMGSVYDLINGTSASKSFQLPSLGVFMGRLTP